MFVSGFTIVRNAIKYDYPLVESVKSVLPICDEFIIALGNSEDDTEKLISEIDSPKIRVIKTVWDDSLRKGGRVLAVETDKAFKAISNEAQWAFYIQADEVLHEDGLDKVMQSMQRWQDDKRIEGLLFNYRHFYGSYDYLGDTRRWYRKEVRVIKNDTNIYSFRDAQGFQKNGKPLKVKECGAWIHHYGWVKHPEKQQTKQKYFHKLWHNDDWVKKQVKQTDLFDYREIDSLIRFSGTHPSVIRKRISEKNWEFHFDQTKQKLSFKEKLFRLIKKYTGWNIGEYKNYKIVK